MYCPPSDLWFILESVLFFAFSSVSPLLWLRTQSGLLSCYLCCLELDNKASSSSSFFLQNSIKVFLQYHQCHIISFTLFPSNQLTWKRWHCRVESTLTLTCAVFLFWTSFLQLNLCGIFSHICIPYLCRSL